MLGAVRPERRARGRWSPSGAPAWLPGYLLGVDLAAAAWAVGAATGAGDVHRRSWWVLALLVGLALAFEEGTAWAAGQRLAPGNRPDIASVWAVTGAVALPPACAVLLLGVVLIHAWLRQGMRIGQPLYRAWFNGSAKLLGCLAAGFALRHWSSSWSGFEWELAGSVSVLVAIAVYSVVTRGLVVIALFGSGARGAEVTGTRNDNLVDIATLSLGGLVAIAALHEPWLCAFVIAPMITLQRGALVHELETAATVDAKTGLLNVAGWEHLAKRELARSARAARPLSVLVLDLDHFKRVNDKFGHVIGDIVLRSVGRCLVSGVREFDAVGRFGGEEFVVVLPDAGESVALVVAERLRERVQRMRLSDEVADLDEADNDPPLTISIGVACAPGAGREIADLLVAADRALYEAKAAGRNCVVVFDADAGNDLRRASRE